ncbi:MAG: D-sedoheptulose 7-phosphate isomerase [Proteobacteria bacterium]|nr:D-sedoheptulose 7-phosphate isomerase [Pseudomonadota bacterium]MBU1739340.1 D-sedoheptulose 7-phosphate isomerase [Pseudomonadota bacterium]
MKEFIAAKLKDSISAKEDFAAGHTDKIIALAELIADILRNGNKVLIFGNGGSAADAQHMAAEFVNRFMINRPPLAAIALTTDTSNITSIGNDFSFAEIFSKQVQALGKKGDLALGISTSGNSPNVVKGIETAKSMGLHTAVLTGGSGGILAGMADITLNVPTTVTPHIQETHVWVEHLLCWLVDDLLFGDNQ